MDYLKEEDGLSYRWVIDITQDKQGFFWFATYDGLNRYDGKNFISFRHSETDSFSISDNKISHVTSDNFGNIWIYGSDQIFNKIDFVTEKAYKINSFVKDDELVSNQIRRLRHFSSLSNGDFVLMFQNEDNTLCSLWKFNFQRNVFLHLIDVPTDPGSVQYFSERADGKLWLWGMGTGYYLVDLLLKDITHIHVENIGLKTDLGQVLPIDKNGLFWFPSNQSSNQNESLLDSFQLPKILNTEKILTIRIDNNDGIWINHSTQDLYYLDTKTKLLEKYTDPIFGKTAGLNAMLRFYTDFEGSSWLGYFYGALRIQKKPMLFDNYFNYDDEKSELQKPFSARDIIELNPNLLMVRSQDSELYKLDLISSKFTRLVQIPSSSNAKEINLAINSMILSKDGFLWSNHDDKLVKTDLNTGYYQSFEGVDYDSYSESPTNYDYPRIYEDDSNNLWWCSKSGLYIFDKVQEKMLPIPMGVPTTSVKAQFIYSSYNSEEDEIYGLYDKGIYIVDCKDRSNTLLEVFTEVENNFLITAILKWKDEFWLSSNRGLIRFNPATKERVIFTEKDGLPSNIIYSSIGSGDELWLATHHGLCQFNPYKMQLTTYNEKHGLANNEFNRWSYLKMISGQLFFGGLNGLSGFDPKKFKIPESKKGLLHLVEFSKYNQHLDSIISVKNIPIENPQTLLIEAYERNISFKFVLTLYSDAKKNRYFHLMEGIEPEWIEDGNETEVRYTQIPPGNYTFRVKAIGPDKTAAENEIAIAVVVKQYWYLRWWAIFGYFLVVSLFIGFLYRIRFNQKLAEQEANKIRELDQLKSKMYANITHEFRTPLTVMLGMNELVKKYSGDGQFVDMMQANAMIDRNGKKLLSLVNQLLDFSKVQSGLLEVHKFQDDIIMFLRYHLEAFHLFAKEKNILIHFHSDNDKIVMDFDAEKMLNIATNLLSNAIKFTNYDGEIFFSANKIQTNSGNPLLELRIKDTGIGIEASKIDHIFERFYQIDNTSTRKEEGTGIGLSLVKELLKLLGGTISVKSTLNKGSVFIIQLPITNLAPDRNIKVSEKNQEFSQLSKNRFDEMLPRKENEDEEKPMVLIVEDNPDVVHYLGICIKDDYRRVFAKNGIEGITKAVELIPDIIISDVMMPLKDGFELCKAVKIDERTSHIPIILLTAKIDNASLLEGLEHGADVYLTKPFNSRELLIRLKNLINLRSEIQKRFAYKSVKESIDKLPIKENIFLSRIKSIILDHIEDDAFDIEQLCGLIYQSRSQLHRKVVALTGQSTSHFIRLIKLEKAKELLSSGFLNVSDVAYQVGFKTQAHFSRVFAETFGLTPSEFSKKETIKDI